MSTIPHHRRQRLSSAGRADETTGWSSPIALPLAVKKPDGPGEWVKGTFELFEDLRQLDRHNIDALIHLGAVTGGCSEEDGINVNVQGTRRLMRYLIDRGTRRFIMASSIAATGCLTNPEPRFVPLQLPMRPDHPCIGRDAYGLSKAMMEEVLKHFSRNVPDADILALAAGGGRGGGGVRRDAAAAGVVPPVGGDPPGPGRLERRDPRARGGAGGAPARASVFTTSSRRTTAPDEPTAKAARTIWGKSAAHLDLSSFERTGHEHDPFWSMDEIREGLGFVGQVPMGPAKFKAWKEKRKS